MSYHEFPEKKVKTRKVTWCHYCEDRIEKGTTVLKQSGVWDGDGFFNGHVCHVCEAFMKQPDYDWRYYADDGIGVEYGAFRETEKYENFKKAKS